MTKQVSDWERLMQATLNRKYMELEEKERVIRNYQAQLRAMSQHISELKLTNKQLCRQVQYLILKQTSHD